MGLPVIQSAVMMCSFGVAPSTYNVLPLNKVLFENKPVGTIMDNKPIVNIPPFGVCNSLANPVTAAQTAAALGVLTPGACLPVIPGPWVPGSLTVMVGNQPVVNNSCQLMCAYGGVITISFPGATTEMVP